ncbi:MAG: F0F1 ATP synthase subunit delta [Candidatus Omnitrophota bacterium]
MIIQLIIIQMLTFGALVFVLRKIMYSASFRETKRLQQLNRENTARAKELAEKIEDANKQYQQRIVSAEEEAGRLKAGARLEAEKIKQEILNKAREESERIVRQALNSKERLKEEIKAETEGQALEIAHKLITNVLSSDNQGLLHQGLVDEAISDIERQGKQILSSLAARMQDDKTPIKVEIKTCYGLTSEQKARLGKILFLCLGHKADIEDTVDPAIIAGMVIRIGSMILDGSLRGRMKDGIGSLS